MHTFGLLEFSDVLLGYEAERDQIALAFLGHGVHELLDLAHFHASFLLMMFTAYLSHVFIPSICRKKVA